MYILALLRAWRICMFCVNVYWVESKLFFVEFKWDGQGNYVITKTMSCILIFSQPCVCGLLASFYFSFQFITNWNGIGYHALVRTSFVEKIFFSLVSYYILRGVAYFSSFTFFAFLVFIYICIYVCVFCRDEIGAIIDELVNNTKKLVALTSREIDKWRRWTMVFLFLMSFFFIIIICVFG